MSSSPKEKTSGELATHPVNGGESLPRLLSFDPKPQRVLRPNRRGFILAGRSWSPDTQKQVKSPSSQQIINSSPTSQSPSPGKNTPIFKNSKQFSKTVSIKRTSPDSTLKSEIMNPKDLPPKKKHKPITWP